MIFLAVEAPMDVNRPKRLNFDAPLLSTKRLVAEEKCLSSDSNEIIKNRVPFSWEQVPGTPKKLVLHKVCSVNQEEETPRLKLPPGRLQIGTSKRNVECEAETSHVNGYRSDDSGGSLESVDVLSLTQAIDMVEHQKPGKAENAESDESDSNTEIVERRGNISPSYIIQRFLPDAAALAATSDLAAVSVKKLNGTEFRNQTDKGGYGSSPKFCGLELLIPWRTKHRICGLKGNAGGSQFVFQPKVGTRETNG